MKRPAATLPPQATGAASLTAPDLPSVTGAARPALDAEARLRRREALVERHRAARAKAFPKGADR